MLIQKLLTKQQKKLTELTAQSQLEQQLLLIKKRQLSEAALDFIGSTPGLMLSFCAGSLFQFRHNSAVKMMRSLVGFRWITRLIG